MTRFLMTLIALSVSSSFTYALDNGNDTLATPAQFERAKKLPGTFVVRISKTRIESVDGVFVAKRLEPAEDFGTLQFTRIGSNVEKTGTLPSSEQPRTAMNRARYTPEDSYQFTYHPRYTDNRNPMAHYNGASEIAGYPIFTFTDDDFAYVYHPTWSTQDVNFFYIYYSWF
jgi:hypothetical protein